MDFFQYISSRNQIKCSSDLQDSIWSFSMSWTKLPVPDGPSWKGEEVPHCLGLVTRSNGSALRRSVGPFREFIWYSLQKIFAWDEKSWQKVFSGRVEGVGMPSLLKKGINYLCYVWVELIWLGQPHEQLQWKGKEREERGGKAIDSEEKENQ